MTRQLAILAIGLLLAAGAVGAEQQQTYIWHWEDGAHQQTTTLAGDESALPSVPELLRDEVLWHRYVTPSIYNGVEVSVGTMDVIASAENGPPIGVELLALEGDGTPTWSVAGPAALAAGAKEADVFASAVPTAGNTAVLVSGYGADSSTPRWTYTETDCGLPAYSLAVSRDGQVVAVAVALQPSGATRLLCFDGVTGTKLSFFDSGAGLTSRGIAISDDGSRVALRASYMVHVIDTATGTSLWSVNVSASAEPIAISGDGLWVATGWQGLLLYHWTGDTYQLAWSQAGGSYYLSQCALSSDGSTLVSGWYRNTFLQNKVVLHDTGSSTPLWTYLYTQASGAQQDIPKGVDMTADGAWAVVGSWGDQYNTNPEVHVFSRAQADPVYTVDTPGSVFDAAITGDGSGGAYVAAGGKHVHANQMGNSGDLYAAHIDGPTAAPAAAAGSGLALSAWPNPFNPKCTLRFTLDTAARARLNIYDATGRLVRCLVDGTLEAGTQSAVWDGRTDTGAEAASGVYLARLAAGGEVGASTLVLLR